MIQKLFDLVTGERRRIKQIVTTLDDFLAHAETNSLTDLLAKKNLEEGVVELVYNNGEHSSNGLLISDDGYFLTARHCVEDDVLPLKMRLYDGTECEIEKKHVHGKWPIDIALAKAKVPGNATARQYNFYKEDMIASSLPIALFTIRDGALVKKYGFTKPHYVKNKDFVCSTLPSRGGDSGGIIATYNFKLLGIHSFRIMGLINDEGEVKNYHGFHASTAISMLKALDLLNFYKHRLESRL